MSESEITIRVDDQLLKRLDRLARERRFPSRSRAIQEAAEEKLRGIDRTRLAREAARSDPSCEQQLADEGLVADLEEWLEETQGTGQGHRPSMWGA